MAKSSSAKSLEKLEVAETEAADYLVRIPLADLKEKYRDYPKVLAYLDACVITF